MALASNRSLAEQNLDMKPRLESQKEALVERYCQLEAVRDAYRQHAALRGRGRPAGRWLPGETVMCCFPAATLKHSQPVMETWYGVLICFFHRINAEWLRVP